MSEITLSEDKIKKSFKSSFTACGFLIAHYLFITIDSLFCFVKYSGDYYLNCLLYSALAALFFWLRKTAKEEKRFSTMAAISMIYIAERTFSLTTFIQEEDTYAAVIQFFICIPIIFFLIRGLKASVDLRAIEYANQKKAE